MKNILLLNKNKTEVLSTVPKNIKNSLALWGFINDTLDKITLTLVQP